MERELRAAHELRNNAMAIAREERDAIRRTELESAPDVAEILSSIDRINAQIEALSKTIKDDRAAKHRRVTDDDSRLALTQLRIARRDTVTLLKKRCSEVDKQIKASRLEIHEKKLARDRELNAAKKCYWTTANRATESVAQACAQPRYNDRGAPSDPRFRRWTGEGQIGGQIVTTRAAGTQFQIERADPMARVQLPPEQRKGPTDDGMRRALSILRLRLGSDARAPIWAEWSMVMPKPLPEDASVKSVTVNKRMVGPKEEWSAQITYETQAMRPAATGGTVAMDLGWKIVRDPLRPHKGTWIRLASWVGEDSCGEQSRGELVLDERAIGGFRLAERLQAQRDTNMSAAKTRLLAWCEGRELPPWLAESVSTLALWKSHGRLAALCHAWRTSRFDGDADGFDALEAWRYKDWHLWSWESGQRKRSRLHRRELARVLAAKLASEYGTLVLSDADYSRTKRAPEVEEDGENLNAKSNMQIACPGELREVLGNAFASRSGEVVRCSTVNMSNHCHACGHKNDIANKVALLCGGCGVHWDVDRNCAMNMLKWNRERLSGNQSMGAARKTKKVNKTRREGESRPAARRRQRAESVADLAAARAVGAVAAE